MSDAARISAEAITALLGGLGRALADAQEELAQVPPVDAFGRPLPSYRIPELDFSFEIETAPSATNPRDWMIRPVRATGGVSQTITSSISGKIVAIPPHGGLPETRIDAVQRGDTLDLRISNAASELLVAAPVELEVDSDATTALHGAAPDAALRLELLNTQRVTTDEAGTVAVTLQRGGLAAGQSVVVLIRAEGAEQRISITGAT